MPPKKKGSKKKTGKKSGSAKGPTIIDGVPVSEMSKEQLEGHVKRLQDELAREREERNFYQLERDRITTFWDLSKKQLEECKAETRIKDHELEEAEERQQMEINVYKQKVKHLLYEQESTFAALKAENMVSMKVNREENQKQEQLHLNDKKQLMDRLAKKDEKYQEVLRQSKLKQVEEIEKSREEFEERVQEMEQRYSNRYMNLRNEYELRLKTELSNTEERKNLQIDNLKKKNEKAFMDIKNYYNDITLNNLAMISTLKEEIKTKEDKLDRNEKLLSSIQNENKKLSEPLQRTKEQLNELQRQLGTQEKDKKELISTKSKLKSCQKDLESIKWELDVLHQKYDQVCGERNQLHENFSSAILEIQRKSSLRHSVLEKKIQDMREDLDIKNTLLRKSEGTFSKGKNKDEEIIKKQGLRIIELHKQILWMKQRQEWGDSLSSSNMSRSSSSTLNRSSSSCSRGSSLQQS
ncbi:dynein regulatory complex subunit 4 [Lepeophtheirus salmonis]|uniref:dynein regulatory complex subunit 4 n=1 Tax=Lepeophtheirus salmonis TaxID=72036 RepID=UPI001AE67BBE|nr:dynein regulatory complex subunit 4-like [Lepeophtheirus salmonis]